MRWLADTFSRLFQGPQTCRCLDARTRDDDICSTLVLMKQRRNGRNANKDNIQWLSAAVLPLLLIPVLQQQHSSRQHISWQLHTLHLAVDAAVVHFTCSLYASLAAAAHILQCFLTRHCTHSTRQDAALIQATSSLSSSEPYGLLPPVAAVAVGAAVAATVTATAVFIAPSTVCAHAPTCQCLPLSSPFMLLVRLLILSRMLTCSSWYSRCLCHISRLMLYSPVCGGHDRSHVWQATHMTGHTMTGMPHHEVRDINATQ